MLGLLESQNIKSLSVLYQNFFSLFAFLALDSIQYTESLIDHGRMYLLLDTKFTMILAGNLSESAYWAENLYRFLPDGVCPAWIIERIFKVKSTKVSSQFKRNSFSIIGEYVG